MADESKGNFHADIADDAVAEALRSVERREREAGGDEIAIDPPEAPVAAPGATAAGSAEVEDLRRQLAEKEALIEESMRRGRESMERLREVNERMLRYAADLDNYKKRSQREKEEVRRFGIEKLLRELLPVMDNLDRALAQIEQGAEAGSLAKGVEMTRRQLEDALGKFEVQSFTAVGQPFDPQVHEALQQVESAEVPANTVVSELVRGYTLAGRLVRPAMVVVSRAPPGAAPQADEVQEQKGGTAQGEPASPEAVGGGGGGEGS